MFPGRVASFILCIYHAWFVSLNLRVLRAVMLSRALRAGKIKITHPQASAVCFNYVPRRWKVNSVPPEWSKQNQSWRMKSFSYTEQLVLFALHVLLIDVELETRRLGSFTTFNAPIFLFFSFLDSQLYPNRQRASLAMFLHMWSVRCGSSVNTPHDSTR